MERIFCPKCHKEAVQIVRNEDKVELRQNGKVILSLSKGSKANNLGVACPSGHKVRVEI